MKLDKVTNRIATPACPDDYYAAFIAGTEPTDTCEHVTDNRNLIQKIFGMGEKPSPPPPVSNQPVGSPSNQPGGQQTNQQQQQQTEDPNKKKPGFWKRIFGGGDDKDKNTQEQQQQPQPQPAPH
jgi:penicillin-binding protein 1B